MKTTKTPQKAVLNKDEIFIRYVYPDTNTNDVFFEKNNVIDITEEQFKQIVSIVKSGNKARLVNNIFQNI